MLLVMFNSTTGEAYIAWQKKDFSFNRLDSKVKEHMYGKKWVERDRYLVGPKEWTQVGPLSLVQWVVK